MTAASRKTFRRKRETGPSAEQLAEAVLAGDRTALSKTITLIESSAERHEQQAQTILQSLLPHSGQSIRIGITGVPGAGKSTFIEAFGHMLCEAGHKVAVLAVDPSSTVNGGSILGDKTRMEKLSRHERAFIRPSPSQGTLGGVHRKTRETMLACEAAGYDVILIETVGVGQSEVVVRGMVDFFMLLAITGAGDELQGMKKGIMELVDAVVINKADGENKPLALRTKREYTQILHLLNPATPGWRTRAMACSSLTGEGIEYIWKQIGLFREVTDESGFFQERRKRQTADWFQSMIRDRLEQEFFRNLEVKKLKPRLEEEVAGGKLTVAQAVDKLFDSSRL